MKDEETYITTAPASVDDSALREARKILDKVKNLLIETRIKGIESLDIETRVRILSHMIEQKEDGNIISKELYNIETHLNKYLHPSIQHDRLSHIFFRNKQFTDFVKPQNVTTEEWLQKSLIAMGQELAEMQEELNYRWWKEEHPIDREHAIEEGVDLLHFLLAWFDALGATPEDIYRMYIQKNNTNWIRQGINYEDSHFMKLIYEGAINPMGSEKNDTSNETI